MATETIQLFRDLVVDATADPGTSAGVRMGFNSILELSVVSVGALVTAIVQLDVYGSNDLENWTLLGTAGGIRGEGSRSFAPIAGIATAFVRVRCSIDASIAIVSLFASLDRVVIPDVQGQLT